MLSPRDESDLSEAVKETKSPLKIVGGGTRPIGAPFEGEVLSTAGIRGITLYEPGALTIVAQAGTPLAEIEAALASENQRLPFEPMDHRPLLGAEGKPTIGGVVAANVSGPRRVQAGACRDSLIGVRFVDGEGTVLKNGGRVMKNVTGYDLVKLLAGSYGTLGVLSEVSLKVLPSSASSATLVYFGVGWTASSRIMSDALTSPYEVSGAARLPAGVLGEHGAVVLRVEGFEASVAYRAEALAKHLSSAVSKPDRVVADEEENQKIWRSVRDVEPLADRVGDIWRVSVKPSDLACLARVLSHEDVVLDWGGGLIWACVPCGTDVRAEMQGVAGHATLIRAGDETKASLGVFHPEPAPVAAISAGLRKKFDPRGILNPGLMG